MEAVDKEVIKKAKRRITRFVKNGCEGHVARVYATEDPMIFKYRASGVTLWFRRDILGRLRRIDPSKVTMCA